MLVFKQWVGEKGMASFMSCVMGHLSMLGMAIISLLDIAMGGTEAPVNKVEECHTEGGSCKRRVAQQEV